MSKRSPTQPPQEQPTTKRIHTEEYEPAFAAINSVVQSLAQSSLPSDDILALALASICTLAPSEARLKEQTLSESKELIMRNPTLKEALDNAIHRQSYEDILSLPILQKEVHTTSDRPRYDRGGVDSLDYHHLDATFKAFTAPYVGGFPQALLKTVDKYFRYNLYNATSIVQSHGTGKSRGIVEAAKIRFVFLFNLGRNVGHYTYPPPDVDVRDYLLEPTGNESIQERYAAFLCSLFTCASELIACANRQGTPLAEWWYTYLNSNGNELHPGPKRVEFYGKVVEEAKKTVNERGGQLIKRLQDSCREFVTLLQKEYSRDKPPTHPPVACILVFDEAQELSYNVGPKECSKQHHLELVLKAIVRYPVFSVFLSTKSSIQTPSPPVRLHPSARVVPDSLQLHPPLTELPFDVFAKDLNDNLTKDGRSTLSAICSVDVMVRFGRTLWYTLQENGYGSIIPLAMAKLNPTQNFLKDELAQLACLAIRIGLDFDASREIGRTTEVKLVESYMRILFTVPRHSEYVRTGTPSEPILAEAAAQLINGTPIRPLNELAPNVLSEAFQEGILAREGRREMVARLLWTLAHDQVVRNHHKSSHVMFHKPISVLDFLHCLFHEDHWKEIDNARPMGDDNGPTLSQAFENAYIYFSHFMDAVNYEVDLQQVYRLLLRGAALSCQRNQGSIDFLTPILFGSPDSTTLSRSNASVLQAQVKNHDRDDESYIDPSLVQSNHPVLSLVHELGTPESSVKRTPTFQSGEELHSRHYQIVSRGCSSRTFGVIPSSVDKIYPMLLGSKLIMEDFPRCDIEECMSLFRRLEPCTGLERGQMGERSQQGKRSQLEKEGEQGEISSWFGQEVE